MKIKFKAIIEVIDFEHDGDFELYEEKLLEMPEVIIIRREKDLEDEMGYILSI